MINVLIVNDSIIVQQLLKRTVHADPDSNIIGIAKDGLEAIELVRKENPDVVLMDISMPRCDGVQATRQIIATQPCCILLVTATIKLHMSQIFNSLGYGVLEVIKTPASAREEIELIKRIKIADALKPAIKTRAKSIRFEPIPPDIIVSPANKNGSVESARRIVVIGASTGGPNTILQILKGMPKKLNAGMIIVQHIDADFAQGVVECFNLSSPIEVMCARSGEQIKNNKAYMVVGNQDLVVHHGPIMAYQPFTPNAIYTPTIDVTMNSIARMYGSKAIGVILTGMGSDGAKGLMAIRKAGGRTIAQDETTSLIYGMPKAAVELQAAEFILPSHEIAGQIIKLLQ